MLSQSSPSHRLPGALSGYHTSSAHDMGNKEESSLSNRRSRKGLGKRFACTIEGCGKSYSRAEHLYRHQLNHNSTQTFYCDYTGCSRTFVRADLLKRHRDRHAAKGLRLGQGEHGSKRKKHLPASDKSSSFSESDVNAALGQRESRSQDLIVQDLAQSSYESDISPNASQPNMVPSAITNVYSTHASSSSSHLPAHVTMSSNFVSNSGALASPSGLARDAYFHKPTQQSMFAVPAATFITPQRSWAPNFSQPGYAKESAVTAQDLTGHANITNKPQEFDDSSAQHHNANMIMLEQMAMPSVGPIFGHDVGYSKSPNIGLPEDFMAYLFNSQGSGVPGSMVAGPASNYGELQEGQYSTPHTIDGLALTNHFMPTSQHVMSVTNLLDERSPESKISDSRSQEIFDFINERFYEQDALPAERQRESILGGNRHRDDHVLSRHMMQAYLGSFWFHFSDQLPILHRPTFSSERAPNLLLLAMMTIGAACLDRTHGQEVGTASAKISDFIARHLRWEVFMDASFRPPAKLWIFQTLILLELYEKMFSTREMHERAHIHHDTTITLMRRGRSLMANSPVPSPHIPHIHAEELLEGSMRQGQGTAGQTADDWWNDWVTKEATRRAAFAAFIIDSTHSAMFGHSAQMVTHEMMLPLPCDESLWSARSSADVVRAEANLNSGGTRPISFLEGLKRTLSQDKVKTTRFGRTALIAGLMSVTYHMNQRELQALDLGCGIIRGLGVRDQWRVALEHAYDSWKEDSDQCFAGREAIRDYYIRDPYLQGSSSTAGESPGVSGSLVLLHHLAHMAMYADIVDCQMFAGAKKVLGRTIGPRELSSAQKRVKEQWAPSENARKAVLHALRYLGSVLLPDGNASMNGGNSWLRGTYETRTDVLVDRPWVLFLSALVVWCYGFALEGPCGEVAELSPGENQQRSQAYLKMYASVANSRELQAVRGLNHNTALLVVLRDSFDKTKWDLLHEGASLLRNCIALNEGGGIAV